MSNSIHSCTVAKSRLYINSKHKTTDTCVGRQIFPLFKIFSATLMRSGQDGTFVSNVL